MHEVTPLSILTDERLAQAGLPAAWQQVQQQALGALVAQHGWAMTMKDADSGRYVAVDDAFATLAQRDAQSIAGLRDADLFEAATAAVIRSADLTALRQSGAGGAIVTEQRFDLGGVRRHFSMLRSMARGSDGPVLLTIWQDQAPQQARDLQLRQALEQIEQQQHVQAQLRSELASLTPRDESDAGAVATFDEQLRREHDLSTREHREFAVVRIAIDAPSAEVLAQGAGAVERVAQTVMQLLRANTRAMDACCRVDERSFAVLLSGVGLATAHARAESLRRQCATQIVLLHGVRLPFTVSMGVASFPNTAQDAAELVQASIAALEHARARGGNNVALASIRFRAKDADALPPVGPPQD